MFALSGMGVNHPVSVFGVAVGAVEIGGGLMTPTLGLSQSIVGAVPGGLPGMALGVFLIAEPQETFDDPYTPLWALAGSIPEALDVGPAHHALSCNQISQRTFEAAGTSKKVEKMREVQFTEPVNMLVGPGFPIRVRTVNGALVLLHDRPLAERDEVWSATVSACHEAIHNGSPAEYARGVFLAYLRQRNLSF